MANPNTPPSSGKDEHNATLPLTDLRTAQSDAAAAMEELTSVAGDIAAEASSQAQHLGEQAQSEIAHVAARTKEALSSQKDALADQVGGVAEAIGTVADELDRKGNATSEYARMLADNAGRFSDTIRSNDVDALFDMANDFGRRQPVAFIAMATVLGFAASRFLVASANRTRTSATGDTSMASRGAPPASSAADGSQDHQAGGV